MATREIDEFISAIAMIQAVERTMTKSPEPTITTYEDYAAAVTRVEQLATDLEYEADAAEFQSLMKAIEAWELNENTASPYFKARSA